MINRLYINFISGIVCGIEIFLGDELEAGDKFAMQLDLGIIRVTYVLSDK